MTQEQTIQFLLKEFSQLGNDGKADFLNKLSNAVHENATTSDEQEAATALEEACASFNCAFQEETDGGLDNWSTQFSQHNTMGA